MKTREFTIFLAGHEEMTEEMAEKLFASGCDDGTPCSGEGRAYVHLSRDADSLEAAIRSAVADVQAAGFRVSRIEIDPESLTSPAASEAMAEATPAAA